MAPQFFKTCGLIFFLSDYDPDYAEYYGHYDILKQVRTQKI
jgi:hypothetical protein